MKLNILLHMRWIVSTAILVAAGFTALAAQADDDDDEDQCSSQAVASLDFVETGVTGEARLCVTDRGLRGVMRTRELTPGNAYTVWWVYLDQPGEILGCPGGGFAECISSFFGADPLAVFGRMDSGVGSHRGKLRFANRLDDMQVTSGSQVWLLIFGHGPASVSDNRILARQLLTPEDPASGAPHLGVEANGYPVATAIFEMP